MSECEHNNTENDFFPVKNKDFVISDIISIRYFYHNIFYMREK